MTRTFVTFLLACLLATPPGLRAQQDAPDSGSPRSETRDDDSQAGGAEIFLGAFRAIRNYHQDAFSDSTLWEKALDGLIEELNDPYASVFTPSQYSRFQEDNTGNYAGIGVTITQLDDRITVTGVFRGTPAEDAGLEVGDRIVAVGDADATSWSVDQASDSIRGPVGSEVKIEVDRKGIPESLPMTIRREEVHVSSVTAETIHDSIGYLRLDRVARNSAQEVDSALSLLRSSRGLVIDLRRNPGGYLDESLHIADLFLHPGQKLASARSRVPGNGDRFRTESWKAQDSARITNVPIVILVDRYTASAAEIVTGALQDHDRALVLGERTFGKGVVQTIMRIPGNRRIRLTTGSWYTPLGRSLHRPRDKQGRPLTEDLDTFPAVSSDSGRPLKGGGGIFPDIPVADDTLSTAQQDLLAAAGEAKIPLTARITEVAVEEAHQRKESGRSGGPLLSDSTLDAFVGSLESDGLPAEAMKAPDAREYLDWRLRAQVASRMDDMKRVLAIRLEKDRVLSRAVQLLESAGDQGDLFAEAARERAERAAETADSGHHPATSGSRGSL